MRLLEIASGLNNKSRIDLTEADSDTDVPEMQLGGIVQWKLFTYPKSSKYKYIQPLIQIQNFSIKLGTKRDFSTVNSRQSSFSNKCL